MASKEDGGTEEQANALGAGKEARPKLSFYVDLGCLGIAVLIILCSRAQVLHFFYDLTSVEQVRHLGCYTAKQGKGASRKHTCSSYKLQTHSRSFINMHTCFGCFNLQLQRVLVNLACTGPQDKREDAAVQLAEAMAKSQKSYDGMDVRSNGGVASKKALGALRRCSPLTVSHSSCW